jgi:hypothetical protein
VGQTSQAIEELNSDPGVRAPGDRTRAASVVEEALDGAFIALRQLAISQYLIDRFFGDFGWSSKEYRGFDHVESELSPEFVLRRMKELFDSVPADSQVRGKMETSFAIDEFVKTGRLTMSFSPVNGKGVADRIWFLRALSAVNEGHLETAVVNLSHVIAANPMSGSAYLLLGQIFYKQGMQSMVLTNMNLALLHPEESGAFYVVGRSALEPILLGRWGKYSVMYYRSEFYAVPGTGEYFIKCTPDGKNVLCQNHVRPSLRNLLLRLLPRSVVSFLRWLVYSTVLKNTVVTPASLNKFSHSRDIRSLVSQIDQI